MKKLTERSLSLFFGGICLVCFFTTSCLKRNSNANKIDSTNVTNTITDTLARHSDSAKKLNYNIYVENSTSMNGYVADIGNSSTEFKKAILDLLSDLSPTLTDTPKLYFVSHDTCRQKPDMGASDLEYYNKILKPWAMQKKCKPQGSLIPNVIDQCLRDTSGINILFSDCIFSDNSYPSRDAAKAVMKTIMAKKISNSKLSTAIYKMYSKFSGSYHIAVTKAVDTIITKDINRPYYIIVFGKPAELKYFLSKIDFARYTRFSNNYFLNENIVRPISMLSLKQKQGTFDIQKPATRNVIYNARSAKNGLFQFSIDVNLSDFSGQDLYLTDPYNYSINNDFKIESISSIKEYYNSSYTHSFVIRTSSLKPSQKIEIALKYSPPMWVDSSSTDDDKDPFSQTAQTQTYGFNYLADGIAQAYQRKEGSDKQFVLSIVVNQSADKTKSSGSFLKFLMFGLVILIAIIIILKNKNR